MTVITAALLEVPAHGRPSGRPGPGESRWRVLAAWTRLRRKHIPGDTRPDRPPPTPMKITQIAVVVRDMDAALKSYTETLGWGPWSVFDYKPPLLHDTQVHDRSSTG